MSPLLTADELRAIQEHARADYPAECCGVVLTRTRGAQERRLLACRNIQDELHAKDPGRFPRTARTAYYIAHEHLLEIGRRESEGFEVHVIYHSHVDTGGYFSETDRKNAMVDGMPAYPAATYVVVGVTAGAGRGDARASLRPGGRRVRGSAAGRRGARGSSRKPLTGPGPAAIIRLPL